MKNDKAELIKTMMGIYNESPEHYAELMAIANTPCPMNRAGEHDCKACWLEYIELAKKDPAAALDMILPEEQR